AFDYSLVKNSGTIDIRGKGAGTYYINFDAGEFATLKNIYMDSNQNVILNIPDTFVNFPQMQYIIGSKNGATQGAEDEDIVAQKIIYNCPNATEAHTTGPTTGTFLVPNADFYNDSVAAGWLVAKNIKKVGGQEWHNVYHDMPDPAGLKLGVTKYYVDQNGQAISWNGKTFTFQIKQKNGSQYPTQTVVATESNKSPYFSGYTFGPYSDSNNHTYTFEVSEINKTDSDVEYDNTVYTVTVVARTYNNRTTVTATYQNGNTTVNKMTFTNKEKVKTTEATIKKIWDDSDDADGLRPASLTVRLKNGSTTVKEVVLNESNGWSYTVDNLDITDKYGRTITYTWEEVNLPSGYELTKTDINGTITSLTNTHTPSKVDVKVIKVWDDNKNQDGIRPTSIDVDLYANGTYKQTVTLNSSNSWSATVTGLPKISGGRTITYSWKENEASLEKIGYKLVSNTTDGYVTTLTNKHTPEETEREVIKVWDDSDNQDGKRPASLKVILLADGKDTGKYVTLNANNKWDAKITNLPKYANGKEITYTWSEGTLPEGYTLTNTKTEGTITTLTNSYQTKTTERTVKKVWNDDDNRDGIRPASLTVKLMNGTTEVGEVTLNE
ncbi:MAG: Cna B-type domain-containing protein, partial [Erysipelotrichaceae bacterium]|nr:Cna B-type domain-containing protein [Erysipelotrichaceae bacterium]